MIQSLQMDPDEKKKNAHFKINIAKKIAFIIIIFVIVECLGFWSPAQAKIMMISGKRYDIALPGEYIPGEIIIRLQPDRNHMTASYLANLVKTEVIGYIPEYQLALLKLIHDANKDQETQVQDTIWKLERKPEVLCAFPNYKLSIPRPVGIPDKRKEYASLFSSKEFNQYSPSFFKTSALFQSWEWHLTRIRYSLAGALVLNAPIIAIIDSGIDYEHPDLHGKVLKGWDFVGDDADPMDENGHGTHLAGIAAGKGFGGILGISPTSKLLAVRVLDRMGSGDFFNIMEGIIYARDFTGVKILNLSLGGWLKEGESAFITFQEVINDTTEKGLLVCVAAGNDNNLGFYENNDSYRYRPVPAWYPNSFTVGATQEIDCRAYFSNYNVGDLKGKTYDYFFVDVVAPGWNILSTLPSGKYGIEHGTSQACAVAAGAGARIWATHKNWTAVQVANRLKSSGRLINKGTNGFYTSIYRIDLMKAMGQKKTGFVGLVYNGQNGQPLPGVTVEAIYRGKVQAKSTSNNAGFFTLKGLKGGISYKLDFKKNGFIGFTYPKLKTVKNNLVDLDMPVFLPQIRPEGQWSLLITWRSWHPGLEEGSYIDPGPNWYPIKWNETHGTHLIPYLKNSFVLNPVLGSRGDLTEEPYAALTQESFFNTIPLQCIVISRQNSQPYQFSCWLGETDWVIQNYGYPTWGSYKGKGINVRAYIYHGASLKKVVHASKAKGQGPFWRIAEITGKKVRVINKMEEKKIW